MSDEKEKESQKVERQEEMQAQEGLQEGEWKQKKGKNESYVFEWMMILLIVSILLAAYLKVDLSFLDEYKGFYLINYGNEMIKFMTE